MNIIERQTFVFSVDFADLLLAGTSQIKPNLNLRFAADTLVLKAVVYQERAVADTADVVQIWCDKAQDNIIGSFPNNGPVQQQHNEHFSLNGTFQNGEIVFEFQQTANGAPFYYNPQPGIMQGGASNTNGIVSFTIEFLRHDKKIK